MAAAAAAAAAARPVVAAQSQDLFSVEETVQQAAFAGNLALVAMLLRKGRRTPGGPGVASTDLDGRNAVHWAAAAGHLHVLEWARKNGCPWSEHTCRLAAEGGHLDVLQWARANGCPWDEEGSSDDDAGSDDGAGSVSE